eukprot:5326970-Pleurochrysis_carterae.AAC.1
MHGLRSRMSLFTLSAQSCPVQLSGSSSSRMFIDLALMLVGVVSVVQVCELLLELLEHLDAIVHRGVHEQSISVLELAQFKSSLWPHGRS